MAVVAQPFLNRVRKGCSSAHFDHTLVPVVTYIWNEVYLSNHGPHISWMLIANSLGKVQMLVGNFQNELLLRVTRVSGCMRPGIKS